MKSSEFIPENIILSEPPEFIKDINGYYDYSLYCSIIEAEFVKPILEEIEESDLLQLQLLDKLSTKNVPKVGDSYIPIFIIYAHQGQIFLQGSLSFSKITKIDNGTYYFDNNQRSPHERLSKLMFAKLYLFDSEKSKEKFLMLLTLKFNDIKTTIRENII